MTLKIKKGWRYVMIVLGSLLFYLLTADGSEALLLLILLIYIETINEE